MKDTLKSIWFWVYVVTMCLLTAAFFTFLHRTIENREWQDYAFIVVLYPAAMYGIGSFFGSLIKTTDYHSEGKLFHLAAFLVVNIIQAVWILGFAPMNLIWFPFVLVAWAFGLSKHLSSSYVSRNYEEA